MSDHDRRKEMIAAAAVAMAQRNIAIAKARFGYQPPEQPSATTAAVPTPAPVTASNDALVSEAARRRAEREAADAAEIKAAWAKVVARANGKRNGAAATGEKPAELTGWAKVIAQMNARVGR